MSTTKKPASTATIRSPKPGPGWMESMVSNPVTHMQYLIKKEIERLKDELQRT